MTYCLQLSEREQQLSAINTDLGNAKQELSSVQSQTEDQKTTLSGIEAEVKATAEQLKVIDWPWQHNALLCTK